MVSREELQQPVFAAIDVLEYPELHDESIPFLAFMTNLSLLLRSSGIKDFTAQVSMQIQPSWVWYRASAEVMCARLYARRTNSNILYEQDVFKPEPARLRKQISAIINFARHREHKLAFWADIMEQAQLASDEAAALEDEKARAVCRPDHIVFCRAWDAQLMMQSLRCNFDTWQILKSGLVLQEAELQALLDLRAAQQPVSDPLGLLLVLLLQY